jgi:hypothetical protein
MRISRRGLLFFYGALLGLFLTGECLGQANVATATLKGTVTDPSKAVIRGAMVTVRSIDKGVSRQAITNEQGEYQVPLLNPGAYEVKVDVANFQPYVAPSVTLMVGQIVVHNIQLGLVQVKQRFVVETEAPLIEPEKSQQSNIIEKRQIENLPNLSRSFTDYVYILPGVVNTDIARLQNSRIPGLRNSGFSIGGGNGHLNFVTLDGGENEKGTGGLRIRTLSIEAIQEFQVNRNAFGAEFGFTTGTSINAVTRSGGNNYHGSLFNFYRSQKTAARNPFDFGDKKPFDQRVFSGFTFGGPIKKSKAFFFTSYERQALDEARFRSFSAMAGELGRPTNEQQAYLAKLTSGPLATADTRRIAASLQGLLSAMNFPEVASLLTREQRSFSVPTHFHNSTTRFDYEPNGRDNFSGRFSIVDENVTSLSPDNSESASRAVRELQRDYTGVGTWNHIFNEGLYNQFRTQFAYDTFNTDALSKAPGIMINGLLNLGSLNVISPLRFNQKRFQFDDTLAWTRGKHNFKFGLSYRPVKANLNTEIAGTGNFVFSGGLPLTLPLSPADQALLTGPLAPPATTSITALQAYSWDAPAYWFQGLRPAKIGGTQHTFGFFEQDSWKVNSRMTVDYGLRIDYESDLEPIGSHTYVSPRLGFAWDVFGDAKTVVRGGGGLFVAPASLQVNGLGGVLNDKEDKLILATRSILDGQQSSVALWRYGKAIGKLPNAGLSIDDLRAIGIIAAPGQYGRAVGALSDNYSNPYSMQASLGVSQLVARDLSVELAYQFYRGVHLPIASESNYRETGQSISIPGSDQGYLFGPQLAPIDPSIRSRLISASWGNSVYHGMTASVTKRFSRLAQFTTNYTYSKAIDDAVDFVGFATPFLSTRRYLDRGLSSFDVRHNFVANGVFDSPFVGGAGRRWYERALADITLSPIVYLRSGFPFTAFLGTDINGDISIQDRPFYAPRNSGRGANFMNVNLRFNKRFYLRRNGGEGVRIEFITEASNLFNRTNYLRVNDVVCGFQQTAGSIGGCDPSFLRGPFDFRGNSEWPPTAPLGFATADSGRQIQFGLKVAF